MRQAGELPCLCIILHQHAGSEAERTGGFPAGCCWHPGSSEKQEKCLAPPAQSVFHIRRGQMVSLVSAHS